MTKKSFWEDPKRVESFAAKAADFRLVEIAKQYPFPEKIKVLDLGCAAGRNTLFMAECGFDIWAIDSSQAMIEKTKSALETHLDSSDIDKRIKVGKMDNLSWAEDNYFDFIIALGIYHNAQNEKEFEQAIYESNRVLKPGGKLLVANFAPGIILGHLNLDQISDHLWRDKKHGNLYLLTGAELDEKMKEFSFFPITKTATVEKVLENGKRVTVNAFYEKREG